MSVLETILNKILSMTLMEIVAWGASIFVFFSFFMKTMIPLRVMAIISNLIFITYALLGLKAGVFDKVYPIFFLHVLLLPLNITRLIQMMKLIRNVHEAAKTESVDFLIPYMRKEEYIKGDIIFRKGEEADNIFFIEKGSILIPEVNKIVRHGKIFGEVGIFSPKNDRAASAICRSDCSIYAISKDKTLELYYQNPKFGFFLIQMISRIIHEQSQVIRKSSIRTMKANIKKDSLEIEKKRKLKRLSKKNVSVKKTAKNKNKKSSDKNGKKKAAKKSITQKKASKKVKGTKNQTKSKKG